MITVFALMRLSIQYLLQPFPFFLTFLLPIAMFFINCKYICFSILFTVLADLIIYWDNFCYCESHGLMILFTLIQAAVMVVVILILRTAATKRKQ